MWHTANSPEGDALNTSTACATALIGACILAVSTTLTWASVEAGSRNASYTLLDLPVAVAVLGVGIALIVGGALYALAGRDGGLELVGVAALAVAVLAGAILLLAESIASLVPGDGIPVVLRILAIGAGAGAGPWIALATALAIAAAAIDPVWLRLTAVARSSWDRGPMAVGSLCVLLVALVGIVQLRQEIWVSGRTFSTSLILRGEGLPCIGVLTFAATWILVVGLVCVCLDRIEIGTLASAFAGWLISFCAAAAIVIPKALVGTPLPDGRATTMAWLAYGLGIAIAATAAYMLWAVGRWT